jgi:hypothetical protein
MKKNNINAKSQSQSQHRGPGRPRYIPLIPRGNFTFTDLETLNGVNPATGEGKNCTTLTLRKWLKRDMYITDKTGKVIRTNHKSSVMLVKDTLAEPNGKNGLGRKQYVYTRRAGTPVAKASPAKASAPRKVKADVTVDVSTAPAPVDAVSTETKDYEAQKAALLAPAVTITPEPETAPVAEDPATPAPEPILDTAPVAS